MDFTRQTFDRIVATAMLADQTYQQVADAHNCSVGKVYAAAVRTGTRKRESRIQSAKEQRRLQASFIEAVLNKTVKGDVLDFMHGVPDASVDLICSSPPYNVGKAYQDGGDSIAPLKYFGWMCQIISEAERVLKPGGVIALNVGGTRDRDGRIVPLDWILQNAFKETHLVLQNLVVWPSAHGLTPKRRLAERHESIMIYSKGDPAVFNPAPGRTKTKQFTKRSFHGPNKGKASSHVLGSWPTDVWSDVGHVGHNHGEKVAHPAQFSEKMVLKVIEIYTNCDALVLDMFSGSGTTQKVCAENGRSFIGADLYYEDIRDARLATAKPQTVRMFPGVSEESAAFWVEELARERAGERAPWRAIAKRVNTPALGLFDKASGE